MTQPVDLLCVRAHPDDESSATGGLLAKLAAEGRRTAVIICTGGEEGEIHDPDLVYEEAFPRLGEIRRRELEAACQVLGVSELYMLGYRDSGMDGTESNNHPDAFCNADLEDSGRKVATIIREIRPRVVVTDNQWGGYGHPDHIMSHRSTIRGVELAADPHADLPGEPWRPERLYVMASVPRAWSEILELMSEEGLDTSALQERMNRQRERTIEIPPTPVTLTVDVADHVETRMSALLCHRTQIPQDSHWMLCPPHLRRIAFAKTNLLRIHPPATDDEQDADLFPDTASSS
jgi:N-acetyl-1-D-myo-inositol-2-amino-2-deoxy-alpha-D-glucopyranoside deacetylase